MPWPQFIDLIKSHQKYWLVCAGILIVNLIGYTIFVAGERGQISQLQKSFQSKRQELNELRKLKVRASEFTDHQKAWQSFLQAVDNKITFPDRLKELEALFRRHDLDPGGLTFTSEPVSGLPLIRFVSVIETAGNYADLKALLDGIRQLPGLFCIERLAITKDREAGTLVARMDLAAYFHDASRPIESPKG